MNRLIGSELASLGRRLAAELDRIAPSPALQVMLARIQTAEATARIRRGASALRINGYL